MRFPFFPSSFSNARERGFNRARVYFRTGNQFPAFYLAPFVTAACVPTPPPSQSPKPLFRFIFREAVFARRSDFRRERRPGEAGHGRCVEPFTRSAEQIEKEVPSLRSPSAPR